MPIPHAAAAATRAGAAAWLALGLLACGPARVESEVPLVVVSVPPQRYVVERLAGRRVDVRVMLPPGASPVQYEPTLVQLREVSRASLYVKVGHPHFPFERSWLGPLLAQNPGLRVVDASAGTGHGAGDPHLWLVPRHVRAMSDRIATALVELLPQHAAAIEANRSEFAAEIDILDAELRTLFAGRGGAEFFVFHPAWGHFAEEYGLRQTAVESEHKRPDVRELSALIERARAREARVVFVQPQFDPEPARVLASEIGARVEALDPLAEDWATNLRAAARRLAAGLT